jgi:hypothetical protein
VLSVRSDCHTAFRKGLYFIVLTVTVVTLPVAIGFLLTVPTRKPRDSHTIVTVTVTEETDWVRSLLGGVTVVTS